MMLEDFFSINRSCALAFSGGTDSTYLLFEGKRCGAQVYPFFVETAFTPQSEVREARELALRLGCSLQVIRIDILNVRGAAENGCDRCYHCKRAMMDAIRSEMSRYGIMLLIDGTNASDCAEERPGMRALLEFDVQSPLRLAGITKEEVIARSRAAGLPTADKPSYSCLATRFGEGMPLDEKLLFALEEAEEVIASAGFKGFRLRISEDMSAKLQVRKEELERAIALSGQLRAAVCKSFRSFEVDRTVFRDRKNC